MGLLDKAREEMQRFVTDTDGFAVSAVFAAPDSSTSTLGVRFTKHKEQYIAEGETLTITIATIAVSEEKLKADSYPTRNADDIIDFKNHTVSVSDSTGDVKSYTVDKWYPDENLGLVILTLKVNE